MANMKKIFVLHTTAARRKADTDADFELVVATAGKDAVLSFRGEYPYRLSPYPAVLFNQREQGRTDEYTFDVEGMGVTSDSTMHMRMMSTTDGWLPLTMWVIGETDEGEFELLGANPNWGEKWFDRGDDSSGLESHQITT